MLQFQYMTKWRNLDLTLTRIRTCALSDPYVWRLRPLSHKIIVTQQYLLYSNKFMKWTNDDMNSTVSIYNAILARIILGNLYYFVIV